MKRQKIIPCKGIKYVCFVLISSIICSFSNQVIGQTTYDIRLEEQSSTVSNTATICFEVQIKSADSNTWELAGQNYRLFYDASKASFISGTSLLSDKYQPFNLVQHAQNIDASNVDGPLEFEENLGFLNYSIDLLDLTNTGTLVFKDTWLSTSQICFELEATEENFSIVWARNGMTDAYATSFVEISSRIGFNQADASQGHHYDDILISSEESNLVSVNAFLHIKAFLQGAFEAQSGLMRDELRALGVIPIEEPYSTITTGENNLVFKHKLGGGETTSLEVLGKNSEHDAIVDWVFIELRDKNDSTLVIATQSALIQRDGDIVHTDGYSGLLFPITPDDYYISIRHRNHLGIMSKTPITLGKSVVQFDFTKKENVYGEYSGKQIGDKLLLWGGNADSNNYIIYQGAGIAIPDTDKMFFDILSDEKNIHFHYNHITTGYYSSDVNMDGFIKYQGGGNDIDNLVFFNIFSYPQNTNYFTNFYIEAQLPKSTE